MLLVGFYVGELRGMCLIMLMLFLLTMGLNIEVFTVPHIFHADPHGICRIPWNSMESA